MKLYAWCSLTTAAQATEMPNFGHVTPWSVQLAYVFCVYALIGLICIVVST